MLLVLLGFLRERGYADAMQQREKLWKDLSARVDALTPALVAWRREFHAHPEEGWTEFYTAARVAACLRDLGFSLRLGAEALCPEARLGLPEPARWQQARQRALAAGADPELLAYMGDGCTAVWAEGDSGRPGPVLALRVDMDALRMTESASLEHIPAREGFASRWSGLMHACGHDAHCALGLGLAHLVQPWLREGRLCGRLRLLFQPAEEGVRGAQALVAAGALAGVTHLLGVHVGLKAQELGTIICGNREFLATSKLELRFLPAGEGGNPLLAACAAALGIQGLPRHGGGSSRVNVGMLHAGTGPGTVPEQARLALECRGATTAINAWLEARCQELGQGAARLWSCDCRGVRQGYADSGCSDETFVRRAMRVLSGMRGVKRLVPGAAFGASEDFSTLLRQVQEHGGQGLHLGVGTLVGTGHHSTAFDIDEACLPLGLEALGRLTADILAG